MQVIQMPDINTEALGILSELEQIMAKPFYTIVIISPSGKRKTRSIFAVDLADAMRWVRSGETIVCAFSQADTEWTVAGGSECLNRAIG